MDKWTRHLSLGSRSLPKGTFSLGRAPRKLGPPWLASRTKPGRHLPG